MTDNYYIRYVAYSKTGEILKKGKAKAKNKLSKLHAMSGFEDFLIKKYKDFGRLEVIECCKESIFGAPCWDWSKNFKDLFKN